LIPLLRYARNAIARTDRQPSRPALDRQPLSRCRRSRKPNGPPDGASSVSTRSARAWRASAGGAGSWASPARRCLEQESRIAHASRLGTASDRVACRLDRHGPERLPRVRRRLTFTLVDRTSIAIVRRQLNATVKQPLAHSQNCVARSHAFTLAAAVATAAHACKQRSDARSGRYRIAPRGQQRSPGAQVAGLQVRRGGCCATSGAWREPARSDPADSVLSAQ
jgi:hypothetical protein